MATLLAPSPAAAAYRMRFGPHATESDSSGQAGPSRDEAMPGVEKILPSKGPAAGGSPVIIDGMNLTGATAVSFGGVEAKEFKVVSPSAITAVSPPHSTGNASVVVTTEAGASAVVPKAIYTFEAPTITAIAPSKGSTSGGVRVTVTGTGFALGGATSFKVGHALALGVNCSSFTVCTMTVPAARKKGVVYLTGESGGKTTKKAPAGQFNYITPAEAKGMEEQEAKEKQEAQEAREKQEAQEAREKQEAQEAKEKQEAQEAKEKREAQEAREAREQQEAKERQEAKEKQEAQEAREAEEKAEREAKESEEGEGQPGMAASREGPYGGGYTLNMALHDFLTGGFQCYCDVSGGAGFQGAVSAKIAKPGFG